MAQLNCDTAFTIPLFGGIPIANNIATADFMIHSTLMNEQYSHQIENFKNTVDVRVKEMQ
jgi:methylglyoxal synthase